MREQPAPPDKIIAYRTRDGVKIPARECVPGVRSKKSPIYSPEIFERLTLTMWREEGGE
jgi:hypothetical protein